MSIPTTTALSMLILSLSAVSPQNYNITSPFVTDWGVWGQMEYCPPQSYAYAFQLNIEDPLWIGDDTALNGLRLHCRNKFKHAGVITSTVGPYGLWREGKVECDFFTGFQLQAEAPVHGDNTAANNIRFLCSGSIHNDFKTHWGQDSSVNGWGEWSEAQYCNQRQAICGIQTQVESFQGEGDDSALNNVRFECCDCDWCDW